MISRTLTDLAAPAASLPDPRAAALAAAARLGIRVPAPAGSSVQAPGSAQAMTLGPAQSIPPAGAGPAATQVVGAAAPASVRQVNAPLGAEMGQQLNGMNTQQVSPQRQAMLDALRARMGGIGMGGQIDERMAELTPTQKAALAARNMVDDRGVFAGQQTGAAIPPYRGRP